jgi:hypothetical protein
MALFSRYVRGMYIPSLLVKYMRVIECVPHSQFITPKEIALSLHKHAYVPEHSFMYVTVFS